MGNIPEPQRAGAAFLFTLFLLLVSLVCCAGEESAGQQTEANLERGASATDQTMAAPSPAVSTPAVAELDLTLAQEDVVLDPQPLRAGFPFSITAVIRNNCDLAAVDVPLMIYLSARQEQIGFFPFQQVLTVTVPASQSLTVAVPVNWNLPGGDHQLWLQVNRLPEAWQATAQVQPEADRSDNIALLDLTVAPFDAYTSQLCPGRVDVQIGPTDVLPEPQQARVLVLVHNTGNVAAYNLPIVVMGGGLTGLAYTPLIPPCGGTAKVTVELGHPFQEGVTLDVLVNPKDWAGQFAEDDYDNNHVAIVAGLTSDILIPPGSGLEEYDFRIDASEIEMPEPWLAVVTVHNSGTRDAADVPITVENEAGRKISDVIPLVRGEGLGVAAIRVGYVWTRGGTLTFTVNPQDARTAHPETNRDNNTARLVLP